MFYRQDVLATLAVDPQSDHGGLLAAEPNAVKHQCTPSRRFQIFAAQLLDEFAASLVVIALRRGVLGAAKLGAFRGHDFTDHFADMPSQEVAKQETGVETGVPETGVSAFPPR